MVPEKNNDVLNFVETGKGKIALVFLHYFGGSSKSWRYVIAELEKNFRCIAIDLRGFGDSPAPREQLSVNDNTKDVIRLIQTLQVEKYVLIGHSMGGKIAVYIASQKPAGLASLILIAPSPPIPEPSKLKDRKDLMKAFGDRLAIEKLINKITARPLLEYTFEETIQTHLLISRIAWNGWIEKGSGEDISFAMQNIDVAVLVISGASDPNFPTEFLKKEFAKYFPTASFEEIKGGHLLPVEAPIEIAKSIKKICNSIK